MSSRSASSQRTRKYRSLLKDKFKTTRLAAIFLLCWLLDGDRLSLHINQRMNRVHEWFALCEWWRHPMENWVWKEKREGGVHPKNEMGLLCKMWAPSSPLRPPSSSPKHSCAKTQYSMYSVNLVVNQTHSDGLHHAHIHSTWKSIKVKTENVIIFRGNLRQRAANPFPQAAFFRRRVA